MGNQRVSKKVLNVKFKSSEQSGGRNGRGWVIGASSQVLVSWEEIISRNVDEIQRKNIKNYVFRRLRPIFRTPCARLHNSCGKQSHSKGIGTSS